MTRPGHVFLVGLPRTGTTLTSAVLNRSEDIGISMFESHFLSGTKGAGSQPRPSFRDEIRAIGDLASDTDTGKIVDFIYAQPEPFWRDIVEQIPHDEFLAHVLQSDRTERALFDYAMHLNAEGKPIPGEKTPGHIRYVPTLLEWFPDARVVHILRDPRATFISQRIKRAAKNRRPPIGTAQGASLLNELYLSTSFIFGWRRVLGMHVRYQNLYPQQYCLMRYEDLISKPEETLREICRFLGAKFSDAMVTDQVNINSSYAGVRQTSGFDKQAIDRWKMHMHPLVRQWFNLWCRSALVRYGYIS